MTHQRKRIRDYVVDLLKDGVDELLGERCYGSRVYPVSAKVLPAICVYTLTEVSERDTHNRALMRQLDLAVDIYDRNADGAPDDDLDALAETVEALMEQDPEMGRRCLTSWLAETTLGFDGEGERANGIARLRYTVQYRTTP